MTPIPPNFEIAMAILDSVTVSMADEIRGICKKHGIALIEDCSHALGAKVNGKSGIFIRRISHSCARLKLPNLQN